MKKMPKTLQERIIRKMIGEDNDTVDVSAELDSNLSLSENITQFKEKGYIKENLEKSYQQDYVNFLSEQQLEKRISEELEDLKKTNIDVDAFYHNLNDSIDVLLSKSSHFNLLIVSGRSGTGKTVQVREKLAKKGVSSEYVSGHTTPLQLYRILNENYNKEVIIFDDCNPILENPSAISLLLQATDTRKVRVVMWNTSKKIDMSRKFEFSGKIIIITNKEWSEIYEPLATRSIKCEVNFDNYTMMKIISSICKLPEKDRILELLKENINKVEINIRLYKLLEGLLLHLKSLNRLGDFEKIGQIFIDLESNSDFQFAYKVLKETNDIKKALKEFIEETGKSRKTFYRYREKINEVMIDV